MKTQRPFFIVGSPRSGTTLLQAMFMAAPGLYIPPETHFLALARRCEKAHGPPSTDAGFEALMAVVRDMCRHHQLPVDMAELEQQLRASPRTHGDQFDALLWHIHSRRPDCRRVGEKSPAHLQFAPQLLEIFPDGKVINVIRDGRDVAVSQEQSMGKRTLSAALGWRRDQRLHARFAETLPQDRYTSVRYEALVSDPEQELRGLCGFLEEPFCEPMLEPDRRPEQGFAGWEAHKARTMQPVTTARVGLYRTELSRSKISLFQAIAGAQLHELGYPLERVSRAGGYLLAGRQLPAALLRRLRGSRTGPRSQLLGK